ncbi:hypothetical protein SDC9_103739 [bioreactor metagenome]|uniref:Uncharacterized protein n=1 Tax=bioreactor metagenome TaxID=1076179 RepID=A0A645AUJ8_9ZZZZ
MIGIEFRTVLPKKEKPSIIKNAMSPSPLASALEIQKTNKDRKPAILTLSSVADNPPTAKKSMVRPV